MTRRQVTGPFILQNRDFGLTAGLSSEAPRVERAAWRGIGRIGDITGQDDSVALKRRIGKGYGRQQSFRIGMQRLPVQLMLFRRLYDFAQIHHGHAITDMAHDAQIMRYKQIAELKFRLQRFEQIYDLRLGRDIQSGNRLVGDNQLRLHGQGAGNTDTLTLAPAEFMWIAL